MARRVRTLSTGFTPWRLPTTNACRIPLTPLSKRGFPAFSCVVKGRTQLYRPQNFGMMAPEHVHRSMRLVAEEVMPRVNARIAEYQAA